MPERIQLSRQAGWRMPANTVKVDRSTPWGNHHRVRQDGQQWFVDSPNGRITGPFQRKEHAQFDAVCRFKADLTGEQIASAIALRDKNIACWCDLGSSCHGDVWLELAKRFAPE